jgi:apolipoprotein N-acyltransferase
MTVSTALRTSAPPTIGFKFNPPSFLRPFGGTALLWMLAAVLALIAAGVRRRPLTASFGFAVVLLLASVACGGGAAGVPSGTPAGTYQVTVTATSGSVNQSIPVTLQVK